MKRIKNNLYLVLSLSIMLVIGTTLAIWHQNVQHINHLEADTIKSEIVENYTPHEPVGTVTKEVSFKNAGTTDVFVRMAYVESWEKEDKNKDTMLLKNQLKGQDVVKKNWTEVFFSKWDDGGDGWFYYKKVLTPGETTEKILSSVTFPDYTQEVYRSYEDADYSLYFKVEMLQASNGSATLNKDDVNQDASQTVFGKAATVDYDTNTVIWQ